MSFLIILRETNCDGQDLRDTSFLSFDSKTTQIFFFFFGHQIVMSVGDAETGWLTLTTPLPESSFQPSCPFMEVDGGWSEV